MFNEESRIVSCVDRLYQYLGTQKHSYEIIFVDDGSDDRTIPVLKDALVGRNDFRILDNKMNGGKGHAVRQGIAAATGEFILFTDTDLSTPISELDKLLPFCDDFRVVIGSRYLEKGSIQVHQPLVRRAISRVGHRLISMTLGLPFADTQCGFKLFESRTAKDIFSRSRIDRWGFDIELLAIARRLGYPVKEVGVLWADDPNSKLRAGKAALNTLKELMAIAANIRNGIYD